MLILSVESSAVSASCALVNEEKVIAEYFINNKLTHSKTLLPMIENMLCTAEIDINDIDLFAVASGPGSFTGIRIGICTVKGLAAPFGKPCAAVSTLESMSFSVKFHKGIICCVMDARCGQVYNALFESDGENVTRLCEDRALTIDVLKKELHIFPQKNILLVGDGADLCYNTFKEENNVFIAPLHLKFQRAAGVAFAAQRLYKEGKTVSPEKLVPFYLRLSQAERNLKKD